MDDMPIRKKYINRYFSEKIMELFREGLPLDKENITNGETRISYDEAVCALNCTISELKNKPILF